MTEEGTISLNTIYAPPIFRAFECEQGWARRLVICVDGARWVHRKFQVTLGMRPSRSAFIWLRGEPVQALIAASFNSIS